MRPLSNTNHTKYIHSRYDIEKNVKSPRNSLFNSVKDIMQALGIKSTKGDFRDTEQTRKNWWFSGKFNKLSSRYAIEMY